MSELHQRAERAAEWFLRKAQQCVLTHRVIRGRGFQRAVDIYGCDVIGKTDKGENCWCQVTTGGASAVSQRRTKLAKIPWHTDDRVFMLQLDFEKVGRSKQWFFNVQRYIFGPRRAGGDVEWHWTPAFRLDIPKLWFRAFNDDIGDQDGEIK